MGEDETTGIWLIFIFWRTLELERWGYIFVLRRLNPSIFKIGVVEGGQTREEVGGLINQLKQSHKIRKPLHPAHLDTFQRLRL